MVNLKGFTANYWKFFIIFYLQTKLDSNILLWFFPMVTWFGTPVYWGLRFDWRWARIHTSTLLASFWRHKRTKFPKIGQKCSLNIFFTFSSNFKATAKYNPFEIPVRFFQSTLINSTNQDVYSTHSQTSQDTKTEFTFQLDIRWNTIHKR